MKKAQIKNQDCGNCGVKLLAMVFAVAWCGATARAAIEEYKVTGNGIPFITFQITWDTINKTFMPAGGFKLTKISDGSSFSTVCLDIGSSLTVDHNYNYSDATFAGQSGLNPKWGAGNGSALVNSGNAAAAIQAAADIFFKHSSVLNGGSIAEQSALQLAVWEALYDTTAGSSAYDLIGGGRFSVASGVPPNNPFGQEAINKAIEWLSQVDPNAGYSGSLLNPVPESQHGISVQSVFYNVTPVPEPTTVIAGALLLLPFAASTVRYLRKNSTRKV